MRKWVWTAAGLVIWMAGCHRRAESPPAAAVEAPPARVDTARAPARATAPAPGPLVVTPEALDQYLVYRGALYAAVQRLAPHLQAPGATDAGLPGAPFAQLSQARAKAAAQAGLSEEALGRIGDLVDDVIARRKATALMAFDEQIHRFEALEAQAPPDQRKAMDDTLTHLKEARDEEAALTEPRQRYGDANVDAVLSREKALTEDLDRWVGLFAKANAGPNLRQ